MREHDHDEKQREADAESIRLWITHTFRLPQAKEWRNSEQERLRDTLREATGDDGLKTTYHTLNSGDWPDRSDVSARFGGLWERALYRAVTGLDWRPVKGLSGAQEGELILLKMQDEFKDFLFRAMLREYEDRLVPHQRAKDALAEKKLEADRHGALAPRIRASELCRLFNGRCITEMRTSDERQPGQALLCLDDGSEVCVVAHAMSRNPFGAFLTFDVAAADAIPFEPRERGAHEVGEYVEGGVVRNVDVRGSALSNETMRLILRGDLRTITIQARTRDAHDWAYLRFLRLGTADVPAPAADTPDRFATTGELLHSTDNQPGSARDVENGHSEEDTRGDFAQSARSGPDAVRRLRQEAHLDALLETGGPALRATVTLFLDEIDERIAETKSEKERERLRHLRDAAYRLSDTPAADVFGAYIARVARAETD